MKRPVEIERGARIGIRHDGTKHKLGLGNLLALGVAHECS